MSDRAIVTTGQGILRGIDADGLLRWRGIPYAQPPVGERRWRAPGPPPTWTGPRDASTYGSRALAPPPSGLVEREPSPMAEDCLHLNVCAPAEPAPPGGRPVLVWIHGGGFREGSGAMFGDGDAFARAGIVVVTPNYRLGALGFAHLAGLFGADEADAGVCGLLDQVAVLAWVRDSIAAFGGDPGRVTVYGESAGAKSIGTLMAARPARGLFARAILSSGGADHVATQKTGTALARRLFAELGCADAAAARQVPAADVLAAQERIRTGAEAVWVWRPTLHPEVLPALPLELIAAGSSAGVDLLIGANGDEGRTFAALLGGAAAAAPADDVLASILGADGAAALLATYGRSRGLTDPVAQRVAAMGDERYGIPTQRLADAQAAHAIVHRYRFDVAAPGYPAAMNGGHGVELPMVWQLPVALPGLRAAAPSPARARLAAQVPALWASFVHGGPPAADGLPAWPAYDPATRAVLILDDEPRVELDPRQAERLAWGERAWPSGTWFPSL